MTSLSFAGTVYYVDATNGNDSNNGLSDSTAWQTINKVSQSLFSPGDSILFKRGEVWRESKGLVITGYDGTSDARITFGAYGSGPKPVINGASIETGWTYSGWGYVYEKAFANEVRVVVEDDTVLTNVLTWNSTVTNTFGGAKPGSWSWNGSKCYVWCTDGADPDTHTMEVAAKAGYDRYGIRVLNNDYVTFENIDIRYTTQEGFHAVASWYASVNYLIVQNCDVHGCGSTGIVIHNPNYNYQGEIQGAIVHNNNVFENRKHGIGLAWKVIDSLISSNTVYDNAWDIVAGWHGISQWGGDPNARPTRNIVEHNIVYGTMHRVNGTIEGTGIQCDDLTKESIVRYNVCYANQGDGIRVHLADGCQIYYNICYNNNTIDSEWRGGISVQEGTHTNIYNNAVFNNQYSGINIGGKNESTTTIRNNIVFENEIWEINVSSWSHPNFSSDYNCIYHSAGGNFIQKGWKNYNWSGWQGLGYDAFSLNQDPLCNNAPNDFSLQSSSPCIDMGIDVGLNSDIEGTSVPQGYSTDIGAYEYTGSSNPSYLLSISSVTGSPAPGSGGSTNPQPGNHSYPEGSSVQINATPNTNYRFSKWTGDISGSNAFNAQVTVTMNKDKSIAANFFTKCGDVNGDLSISPADAQTAFDIFLGRISNPTESERENADVNCDGTKTEPTITPADAHAIFEKFIGKNELPCSCSCNSRSASVSSQTNQTSNVNLVINNIQGKTENEIVVSITTENPIYLNAFGFDLIFPPERFEFVGVEKDELQKDYYMIDANKIAEGVIRAGGYRCSLNLTYYPRTLIKLVFRVIEKTDTSNHSVIIVNTVDDIKNASVKRGFMPERKIRSRNIH